MFYRVLSRSMTTQTWDVDDFRKFSLMHSFITEFQFAKTTFICIATVTGSVRNNLSALHWDCSRSGLQEVYPNIIRIYFLKTTFRRSIPDADRTSSTITEHWNFQLSTSDKFSAPLISSLYFNAKSAADFYSSSTNLTACASLVTQLKSSQTSLSFSNLHWIRPKMTSSYTSKN